jgi:hypothetical protein
MFANYCHLLLHLYNMIFEGNDLTINNLIMQLKLENWVVDVHFIGYSEVNEHGIVVEHGVENEIKLQGLEMLRTN